MGTATSERTQALARQGYFVVTMELPEIQTVTVWMPCCGRGTSHMKEETFLKYIRLSLDEKADDVASAAFDGLF